MRRVRHHTGGLQPRQICLIGAGVVHAIRARTRAQIESTQIIRQRPHRTRGGQVERARGTGDPRSREVPQNARSTGPLRYHPCAVLGAHADRPF
jgi:hypothetical protein